MHQKDFLYRLDFHNHFITYNEINPKRILDYGRTILNRQYFLTFHPKLLISKFIK
jgi:hypothetical protein